MRPASSELRRPLLSLVVALCLVSPPLAAQGNAPAPAARASGIGAPSSPAATQTPEAFARAYVATLTAADYAATARLMHPDALGAMRRFVDVMTAGDENAEVREQLLGVRDARAAAALTDAEVYARFLDVGMGGAAGLGGAMRGATFDVLGHVDETPAGAAAGAAAQTHVLYRLHLTLEGVRVAKVDVLTLRRAGTDWRAMLAGDLEGMITRMSEKRGG
jgi:hypothetical protein